MFNYQCPNGFPPEECSHIPQLILNAAQYFQQKQPLRQESAKSQAQESLKWANNSTNEAKNRQKQRRHG